MFTVEKLIFSKEYRKMVADLKKIQRQETREEVKLDDIRTGEGAGRKGSADMSHSLPKSGQSGGNPRKKSGQIDRETEKDRDTGTASPNAGEV